MLYPRVNLGRLFRGLLTSRKRRENVAKCANTPFPLLGKRTPSSLVRVFSGIVRERGRVVALSAGDEQARLSLAAPQIAAELKIGDSLAVDGCCLTVVEKDAETVSFDVSSETLSRSTLGALAPGSEVNLEPATRAGDPLGGHFVQGHVDGVGRVRSLAPEGDGVRMWIEVPPPLRRYCVEKGSIAVGGVSLTIAEMDDEAVAIALIPHTLTETTLGAARPGDGLNLEADVIAKYVERLLAPRSG